MKKIFAAFLLSAFTSQFYAATRLSTGNGSWFTNTTWSPSGTPGCGDSLIIQANHTVTINNTHDLEGCGTRLILVVRGTLQFGNGDKLRLPCNSKLYVFGGGKIRSAGGGGNSNLIEICNVEEWSAGDGDFTGPGCMPPNAPGCAAIVLPIELISFEGTACDRSVCLSWVTQTEKNNSYFEIEVSSDGHFFKSAGMIVTKAQNGNSHNKLTYEHIADKALNGINYYRLKQVDLDGSFSYSRIIAVSSRVPESVDMTIFPNPTNGSFSINVSEKLAGAVSLKISNIQGKVLYTQIFSDPDFLISVTDVGILEKGSYVIELSSKHRQQFTKLMVN